MNEQKYSIDDPRLTAFALGELEGEEARGVEAFVEGNVAAQEAVREIRECASELEMELAGESGAELTVAQRAAIDAKLEPVQNAQPSRWQRVGALSFAAAAMIAFLWIFVSPMIWGSKERSAPFTYTVWGDGVEIAGSPSATNDSTASEAFAEPGAVEFQNSLEGIDTRLLAGLGYVGGGGGQGSVPRKMSAPSNPERRANHYPLQGDRSAELYRYFTWRDQRVLDPNTDPTGWLNEGEDGDLGERVAALYGSTESPRPVLNINDVGVMKAQRRELLWDPDDSESEARLREYIKNAGREPFLDVITVKSAENWKRITQLKARRSELISDLEEKKADNAQLRASLDQVRREIESIETMQALRKLGYVDETAKGEGYEAIVDNPLIRTRDDSLSTFSIDVDTASYANVRRYLIAESKLPPADAVRIEELVNYFPYDYPAPEPNQPFSVNVEIASAPWQAKHRLVKIGLKGREPVFAERVNANLVFLLDVSGSMDQPLKLPLLVDALSMLVKNLDPSDRVAIVVYAGSSGLVLDSTSCSEKPLILKALERLDAGGSTNGGDGIRLAYDVARRNYIDGGINRVILATDGDFNVGATSDSDLEELITEKAKNGVFLSVLGFGTGNLQDAKMEMLADKGNGNYSYIDSSLEARKVLVEQMGGTLVAIAKDVKMQVEFNPAEAQAFRLIGYENRILEHQDFNDDTKDAGEIGSGHTVTALYEVVPVGVEFDGFEIDPLRYENPVPAKELNPVADTGELLTLKLRYKQPAGSTSTKLEFPIRDAGLSLEEASDEFRFAASVASFGMLLRDSRYKGSANWEQTLELARSGSTGDVGGYRLEFEYLVQRAGALSK